MERLIQLFFIGFCVILHVLSKEDVLSDKVKLLSDRSFESPVIRLNSELFKQYVKSSPKNYSMVVMFTALAPQRQCPICSLAHDEFQILARSYRYSNAFSKKVFFGMVDFDEASDVFQSLKLNTAPVFIHFPEKSKPQKADYMDLNRWGYVAERTAQWVYERTEVQIQIYRPPHYSRIVIIASISLVTLGLLYVKRHCFKLIFNRVVWGVFVIGTVCCFISGQTWNFINNPPFMGQHKQDTGLFADDSNMQYVAETYIVFLLFVLFLLHFGVSIGVILLNEAPRMSFSGRRNSFVALIGTLVVVILFSYILSIFRSKYQGYPYSFLIK